MSEGIRRDIPIKLGDFSVIDTEFSSIRERFDAEMGKMEEEMSKFRSELMNRESNNFFRSTTRFVFHMNFQNCVFDGCGFGNLLICKPSGNRYFRLSELWDLIIKGASTEMGKVLLSLQEVCLHLMCILCENNYSRIEKKVMYNNN